VSLISKLLNPLLMSDFHKNQVNSLEFHFAVRLPEQRLLRQSCWQSLVLAMSWIEIRQIPRIENARTGKHRFIYYKYFELYC
jgi:hypothetical protein